MMHHKTKSGNKMLGGFADIIWTNINIFTFHSDRDPESSNRFFSQDTLAYDDISSD